MIRTFTAILFMLCLATGIARAQFVTQNDYVEADVSNDGLGLVRIYYANTTHGQYITHPGYRSYLTVMVNGNYYTNNMYPDTFAPFSLPLNNGKTQQIGDTIETVWHQDSSMCSM